MGKISMRKISEVLRQRFELGRTYREIASSLGIAVGTVNSYVYSAKSANISWPLPDGMTEQALYDALFLPSAKKTRNRVTPDWPYIHKELCKKGVTLQLLWREYRDIYQDGLGYSQFCNLYAEFKKQVAPTMRQRHKAGEKAFVDYSGLKIDWLDTTSGEIHSAEVFVGCLGASQYIFAEATATQALPDWITSHINMFEFFGGVPEILVPDNLRSGVSKSHRYDPDINANYQLFSEYYGVAIVPARIYSPKDKSKAENAVSIVERQILAAIRNKTFTSVYEINVEIKARLQAINSQKFQKMDTSRIELFESLDKPALKALPAERYQYSEWKKAKINVDYHFAFEDRYYSVPYKYIGKYVEVKANNTSIECFYSNKRIAIHPKSPKKYSFNTIEQHMPKGHQEHAKFTPERLRAWAKKIGSIPS